MTNPVQMSVNGAIAVITIDNPPVNALSQRVRQQLLSSVAKAAGMPDVKAILIHGAGRIFVAGADIREFGKPPQQPFLPDLINAIEATPKPVIVALHGTVLGGGLELSMGAHYRVAAKDTKFALPEVKLGLLPGAGGTQRLPRLIPVEHALEMVTTGKMIGASEALDLGLVDKVVEDDEILFAGLNFARDLIASECDLRKASERPANTAAHELFDRALKKLAKSAPGQQAPQSCVAAVKLATQLPFAEGQKKEREMFLELLASDEHKALAHVFFAERAVRKLPEIANKTPRTIANIGVVGGGTMGAGIAASALLSGLKVTLVERDRSAMDRADVAVKKLLFGAVKRGKLSQTAFESILANGFLTSSDYADLAAVDLVIEAVFEDLDVKREVFKQLDAVCKEGAILASNTSYLDLNAIAEMTSRPQDVIGLHFFSPAHIMKLLEIIVGNKTAPEVTATGFALAKQLGKVPVRAGVCDGFIGNRILAHYRKALDSAVLAGASPYDVDQALVKFGLAMGPYAVSDLAGLDIGWATRKRLAPTRDPRETYAEFADRLCEQGRFGQKTGRGFYIYDDAEKRQDPEVIDIISSERVFKGLKARDLSEQDIVNRFIAAIVNEAARILADGLARRPLEIDVTLLNGYGFPRWRGGPMHYADTKGLAHILDDIKTFAAEDAFLWQPAPLLETLVAERRTFSDLNSKEN